MSDQPKPDLTKQLADALEEIFGEEFKDLQDEPNIGGYCREVSWDDMRRLHGLFSAYRAQGETKWRLLVWKQDRFQKGDQFLEDDCVTWSPLPVGMEGFAYTSAYLPHRRPITEGQG